MRPSLSMILTIFALACLLANPDRASAGDSVRLKDGSIIYGEIHDMAEENLRIKIGFALEKMITIKWGEVVQATTDHPLPFRLKDGTVLVGTLTESEKGTLKVKVDPLGTLVPVPLDMIATINRAPVEFQGNFTLGISGASGNSEIKNVSGLAELVARGEALRLSLIGRYIYGEAAGEVAVRNARGTIKLDFFVTKRFFLFTSAFFEQDTFQDLNLRTALAAGPGYQFLDKGDLTSPYTNEMQLYGEVGVGYFNEDFKLQPDKTSVRLRFSAKWDWPIIKDKIAVYHYNEVFPSLENFQDFYLTTDQGLIFTVIEHFVAKLQVTYRYNNRPPPGIESSDTIYLITFGYSLGK